MAGPEGKMGYDDITQGGPSIPGNKMGQPHAAARAAPQLNASQDIGIHPAQAPRQPAGADHGGPWLPTFNLGASGGLPGEGAGAGEGAAVGEAAGGADAIGELAPLLLAAA
jgi:hypothetical protein